MASGCSCCFGGSVMAFDRVKALGEYLAQCANLPNFDELLSQQCGVLAQQIRDAGSLEFAEGAALLALIQQEPHWKESHRHTLVGVVQSKVEEGRGSKPLAGRTPLQDFCWFPVYLTEAEWKIVLDNKATSLPYRTNIVTERCFRLGLKAPSEETYAMCATVLLLPEQERFGDAVSLRSSYITVKDLVKQCLKAKSEEEGSKFEFLKQLPADPRGLEPERLDAAYGPGVRPPARLPEGPAALPAPPATEGQLQILAGEAALPAPPAPQVPEPIPSGVAAPNVLPSAKKAVTVIPVMASTQPSPKKAALAIKDCAEAKPAIASKNALESNAKLEQALEARATGKKEEKDAEQKE
eukprot:symbB.v1.2.035198.t1/scaffold4591.1/size37605/3